MMLAAENETGRAERRFGRRAGQEASGAKAAGVSGGAKHGRLAGYQNGTKNTRELKNFRLGWPADLRFHPAFAGSSSMSAVVSPVGAWSCTSCGRLSKRQSTEVWKLQISTLLQHGMFRMFSSFGSSVLRGRAHPFCLVAEGRLASA